MGHSGALLSRRTGLSPVTGRMGPWALEVCSERKPLLGRCVGQHTGTIIRTIDTGFGIAHIFKSKDTKEIHRVRD